MLADASLALRSSGWQFGDSGFYFTVRRSENTVWAKYVTAMKESIHVYVDNRNDLRADHVFRFGGMPFLKLHYSMPCRTRPRPAPLEASPPAAGIGAPPTAALPATASDRS